MVESGRGCHAYWLLRWPIPLPDEAARLELRGLLRRLVACVNTGLERLRTEQQTEQTTLNAACHADANACDPPRILRVPGTINHKDPACPRPVRLAHSDVKQERFSWTQWQTLLPPSAENLTEALAPERKVRPAATGSAFQTEGRAGRVQPLPPATRALLHVPTPEGTRHAVCKRLLMAARHCGHDAFGLETLGAQFCLLNHFPEDEMRDLLAWTLRRS